MRVSFVLLPENTSLDGEAIARSHLRLTPEATRLVPEESKDEGAMLGLRLQDDSGDIILAVMPAPIATGEVEAAAQLSITALGGDGALPPHVAHVVVTFRDEGGRTPAQQASVLAQVTAAVADATSAVGVYWGAGHVAHPTDFFTELVGVSEVPVPALTGVSIAREGSAVSLLSVGMEQFELPDMLVLSDRSEGSEALGFLQDMLAYTLERGTAIPEGDTVGRTAEERLQVHYVPSPAGGPAEVARIDLRRPGLWARAKKLFLA